MTLAHPARLLDRPATGDSLDQPKNEPSEEGTTIDTNKDTKDYSYDSYDSEDNDDEFDFEVEDCQKHVEYIRTDRVPAEYKFQVYHYFTICDTIETMYFVSYDPRFEVRPIHIVTVHREEIAEDLDNYKTALLKFIDKLNEYETQIIDTF